MHSYSTYLIPIVLALLFHLLVGVVVGTHWFEKDIQLDTTDSKLYLRASLVRKNPIKKVRQSRRQPKPVATPRKAQPLTPAPSLLKLEEPLTLVESQVSESRSTDTALARIEAEQSLLEAIRDEQARQIAVTDDEKALAYVSQIKRDIIQNWSRPPSARNGMQTLLKVFLVPTGEVVDVAILEPSGNDAFDRSAVLAVQKAEVFLVPERSSQFERNFREFTVLFKPEDLRL